MRVPFPKLDVRHLNRELPDFTLVVVVVERGLEFMDPQSRNQLAAPIVDSKYPNRCTIDRGRDVSPSMAGRYVLRIAGDTCVNSLT